MHGTGKLILEGKFGDDASGVLQNSSSENHDRIYQFFLLNLFRTKFPFTSMLPSAIQQLFHNPRALARNFEMLVLAMKSFILVNLQNFPQN